MTQSEIQFRLPIVDGNKIIFSWFPNSIFKENQYWVEYPDLQVVTSSPGKLTEALFPICLGLSVLNNTRIVLPVKISDSALRHWRHVIQLVSLASFRNKAIGTIVNGEHDAEYQVIKKGETVLSFGGGAESLLSLARLLQKGIRPTLASFGGPFWSGSNPEQNGDKFVLDERISRDFRLPLLRVRSNFKSIINDSQWKPYLDKNLSVLDSVLFLPFFISFLLPVSEQLNIGRMVTGIEKMYLPKEHFCFTPVMTSALGEIAHGFNYEAHLSDLHKDEICRELYQLYPDFAHYQYSCWHNKNERWCHQCETCLEYFALLKANRIDVSSVGMNEGKIQANREKLIHAVSASQESRKGEVWERIYGFSRLRSDSILSAMLDEIKRKSSFYHFVEHIYQTLPEWIRLLYRQQKGFFKRLTLQP